MTMYVKPNRGRLVPMPNYQGLPETALPPTGPRCPRTATGFDGCERGRWLESRRRVLNHMTKTPQSMRKNLRKNLRKSLRKSLRKNLNQNTRTPHEHQFQPHCVRCPRAAVLCGDGQQQGEYGPGEPQVVTVLSRPGGRPDREKYPGEDAD